MLRIVSSLNTHMTSRESTPKDLKIRANSFAKETFTAWKALHAYFSASALRTSTKLISWPRNANMSVSVVVTRSSAVPTTTKGGLKKSATPDPSRRNSGHIAVPTAQPDGSDEPAKVG